MQTVKVREERYEKKLWKRAKSWGRRRGKGGKGRRGKSLWKGQMAEDISLLNGIPPANDEIYNTYLQLIKSVCVHSLCQCLFRSLARPQRTGLKDRMLDLQTSWEGKNKRAKHCVWRSQTCREMLATCALGQGNAVQCKVKQHYWTLICTILRSVWQINPI